MLQNELQSRLPADFLASLPLGVEISYAAIPQVRTLNEPLKTQVRAAFAESLDVLWEVMIAISVLGFLSAWLMRQIPLQQLSDENWGLMEQKDGAAAHNGTIELDKA